MEAERPDHEEGPVVVGEEEEFSEEEELDELMIEDRRNRERILRGGRIPRKERPITIRFNGEERLVRWHWQRARLIRDWIHRWVAEPFVIRRSKKVASWKDLHPTWVYDIVTVRQYLDRGWSLPVWWRIVGSISDLMVNDDSEYSNQNAIDRNLQSEPSPELLQSDGNPPEASEVEADAPVTLVSEIEKNEESEKTSKIEKSGDTVESKTSELEPEAEEREMPETVFEIERGGMSEEAPETATSVQIHLDDEEMPDVRDTIIPQNDGCTSEGDLEPGVGSEELRDRDPESGVRITRQVLEETRHDSPIDDLDRRNSCSDSIPRSQSLNPISLAKGSQAFRIQQTQKRRERETRQAEFKREKILKEATEITTVIFKGEKFQTSRFSNYPPGCEILRNLSRRSEVRDVR
jgi:hypothetical protein